MNQLVKINLCFKFGNSVVMGHRKFRPKAQSISVENIRCRIKSDNFK
jgi:hypothetical protein